MAEESKPATSAPNPAIGKTKHRSPNYPIIGLRKAVERTQEMYKAFKRSVVPIGVAHKLWEYKEHSGAGNQVVSAIKAFGLIEVQGTGDARQLKITDVGYQILEDHPNSKNLLKAAALAPSLYSEVWQAKCSDGLPNDELLRHYLKWDRKFNPESIDSFIAQFKDTVSYAKLDSSDKVDPASVRDDGGDSDEAGDDVVATEEKNTETGKKPPLSPKSAREDFSGPTMVLDLPRGNRIEIRLRSKVTSDEFAKIKRIYDLSELSFVDDETDYAE